MRLTSSHARSFVPSRSARESTRILFCCPFVTTRHDARHARTSLRAHARAVGSANMASSPDVAFSRGSARAGARRASMGPDKAGGQVVSW